MSVLVDTSVWSAALRKNDSKESLIRDILKKLVSDGVVEMIGPIRQELLSGIKEPAHFEKLRDKLRSFEDLRIESEDYEEAASYYNLCRSKGIQGSGTDLIICAMAIKYDLHIFTTDKDFEMYATALPIRLYKASEG